MDWLDSVTTLLRLVLVVVELARARWKNQPRKVRQEAGSMTCPARLRYNRER